MNKCGTCTWIMHIDFTSQFTLQFFSRSRILPYNFTHENDEQQKIFKFEALFNVIISPTFISPKFFESAFAKVFPRLSFQFYGNSIRSTLPNKAVTKLFAIFAYSMTLRKSDTDELNNQ